MIFFNYKFWPKKKFKLNEYESIIIFLSENVVKKIFILKKIGHKLAKNKPFKW